MFAAMWVLLALSLVLNVLALLGFTLPEIKRRLKGGRHAKTYQDTI